MPACSLVIPCYNEADNLPLLVDRCADVFAARDDVEVVLVDNGSTDRTAEILPGLCAPYPFLRSVRVPVNEGYGHGILTGLRAAKGQVLAWTHADLQTDPSDLLVGLDLFANAADPERLFVKGRRYGRPPADVVFTVGMAVFETGLLRVPMWDINAQPTMFPRSFFEAWSDPPKDFSLDLFAYYSAVRSGLTLGRFPVHFGKRAHGISRWNVNWQAKVKFIRRTVDYSLAMHRERVRVIVVAHRRNALASLDATPPHHGVEMDVRLRGDRLVVAHDPFEDGPDLDAWLDRYRHALLIVNVKEEGLEAMISSRLAARAIDTYFFLDQSFPFLMRTLRTGESRCSVRVSEYEHPGTALALAGRAGWVWLDGFHGFPVSADVARSLKEAGYRICLVSPELHGRAESEIQGFRAAASATGVDFDAVCTRVSEAWGGD